MSAFNDPRLLKIERQQREGPPPVACDRCGYDLAGLAHDARCPECGAPRPHPQHTRLDPGAESQGLVRASTPEQLRFSAGFAGLTLSFATTPVLLLVAAMSTSASPLPIVWLTALWWVALALLLLRRFTVGFATNRYATSAPPALITATLATQWVWFAAAAAPIVLPLPTWATPILVAIAALGLFPTMWCVGDLLEWGGDSTTGQNTKWLLLMPIYVGLIGAAIGYPLSIFVFRVPGVITIMLQAVLVLSGLYVYCVLVYRLASGVTMGYWARRTRKVNEGRLERIDARRAAVEAEQAARVAHNERVAQSMHANKDKPVGFDDFDP